MSVVFHAVRRNFSMLNSCLRICSGLPGSKIDFRSNWHLKLWWFTSHLKEYGSLSFYLAASAVNELRGKIKTLHCGQKQKEKNWVILSRPAFYQGNRPGFSVSKGQGGPSNPPQANQSKPTTKSESSQSKQSQKADERLKSDASPGSVSAPITIDGKTSCTL